MMRILQLLIVLCVVIDPLLVPAQLERLKKFKHAGSVVTGTPMIEILAGEFIMGLDGTHALEDERPAHRVWLDTFAIDQYEVTTAQYGEFINTIKRELPWQWETVELFHHSDRPVIGVDWHNADAYCRWKDKRLPTEAEWEKAARGTDGRFYPWGNQAPTNQRANFALGLGSAMTMCFHRCNHILRAGALSASIIWQGMCMNGCRTGMRSTITTARRIETQPGRYRVSSRWCAAGPGRICRSISLPMDDSNSLLIPVIAIRGFAVRDPSLSSSDQRRDRVSGGGGMVAI